MDFLRRAEKLFSYPSAWGSEPSQLGNICVGPSAGRIAAEFAAIREETKQEDAEAVVKEILNLNLHFPISGHLAIINLMRDAILNSERRKNKTEDCAEIVYPDNTDGQHIAKQCSQFHKLCLEDAIKLANAIDYALGEAREKAIRECVDACRGNGPLRDVESAPVLNAQARIMKLFGRPFYTWCPHIEWVSYGWCLLRTETMHDIQVGKDWTECPVCRKPRPVTP